MLHLSKDELAFFVRDELFISETDLMIFLNAETGMYPREEDEYYRDFLGLRATVEVTSKVLFVYWSMISLDSFVNKKKKCITLFSEKYEYLRRARNKKMLY